LATKDSPPDEERDGNRVDHKRAEDDQHDGAHGQRLRGIVGPHTVKT
jgi:hypothetical protein